jgi:hypothetical protein
MYHHHLEIYHLVMLELGLELDSELVQAAKVLVLVV